MKRIRAYGWGASLALAWAIVLGGAVLLGRWIPFGREQDLGNIRAAPSLAHPFGTDARGLDMVGRIVDGARNSLFVGIGATVIALVAGTAIGLFAGYRRGRSDQALVVGLDVFAAFPPLVAALAAVFIWGPGLDKLTIVLGVLGIPIFARVARAVTLPLAEREFVLAARATGAGHTRVMLRELVPNIAVPVLAYGLVAVGLFVVIEGALSFFGAGLPEGYDSWGKLIAAGQEQVDTAPHLVIIPTGVLVLTVVALNSISERWQERWLFGKVPRNVLRAGAATAPQVATEEPAAVQVDAAALVVDPERALAIEHLHTWLATPIGEVRAVTDVDLLLRAGSLTALVGESGSGKTMLARSVLGLVTAPTVAGLPGRIMFGDIDLRALPQDELRELRGRRVAMVFQDPMTSLDPVQRISRQLTEPMRAHLGMTKQEARTRAVDLLTQVGVPDPERRLRAYPNELSGGLRQRVAIAIALSCDPDVVVADEPTSALDVTVQAQILDVLDRLRAERRLAVLLITHDLGIVATRADDVAVMYGGRIVEHGATADVFATPHHPYTRALLDAVPRVDHAGHVRLAAIGGAPPILLGDQPGCSFAPRCQAMQARCLTERPPLEPLAGERQQVACWFPLNAPVPTPVRTDR